MRYITLLMVPNGFTDTPALLAIERLEGRFFGQPFAETLPDEVRDEFKQAAGGDTLSPPIPDNHWVLSP